MHYIIIIGIALTLTALNIVHEARQEARKRQQRTRTAPARRAPLPKPPKPVDPEREAIKQAREHRIIANLIVQSDRLNKQIRDAEKRDNGLTDALVAKQEAINAEIEARRSAISYAVPEASPEAVARSWEQLKQQYHKHSPGSKPGKKYYEDLENYIKELNK